MASGTDDFRQLVGVPARDDMTRRGFDMIYLDAAKYGEFMKADDEDNGKALKSLGLAK